MQENKKKMISLGITVMTLLLIVVGATYAYFAAQIDNGASTDVDITAESVDSLTFTTGDPISFKITQDNFKQGGNNLSGSTTATASLIAGKDRTAIYNYNIYLNIAANNFIYTKDTNTPELLLKVTGPNGEVTSINGLTYNSTLKGFDITSKSGQIKIVDNYEISTPGTKTDNWTVEIIFRNLDSDQTANSGKMVRAELLIEKEESSFNPTLADVCREGDNLANCIKAFADSNTYEVTKIIKHDGSNTNDANDGSYRYSGADVLAGEIDENVIGSTDIFGTETSLYYYFKADFEPGYIEQIEAIAKKNNAGETLTEEEESMATEFVTNWLNGTYNIFDEKGGIAAGYFSSAMQNFVCFGSNVSPCPKDNLYRIIGVFGDQVKLIKSTDVTSMAWAKQGSVGWDNSLVNEYLNTTYLNSIKAEWQSKIAITNWSVGGVPSGLSTAKKFYDQEMKYTKKAKGKIGLMYVNDFLYGADSSEWDDFFHIINDWLTSSISTAEWTITSSGISYTEESIFTVWNRGTYYEMGNSGYASWNPDVDGGLSVNPVFYLNADITYLSGTGTATDPIRIN